MPFFVFQDTPLDEGIVEVMSEVVKKNKTIACCTSGEPYTKRMIKLLQLKGIPVLPTPERAVKALKALIEYRLIKERLK